MKKFALTATLLLSITAHSSDWQGFAVPESLGQNVNALNAKYNLNLQRDLNLDLDKDTLTYSASHNDCLYIVNTNQNHDIQSIHISQKMVGDGIQDCQFKTENPIAFELEKTTVNQLIAPIKNGTYNTYPTQYFISPVCFDCPASGMIGDVLEIANVKQEFKLQFEVLGDNQNFQKEVAMTYLKLKKYNPNKHYDYMKKLEKKFAKMPTIYQSEKFKKIALKHYGNGEVFSYTLSLK